MQKHQRERESNKFKKPKRDGREDKYLVNIHVHLKPFQCLDNYIQLHLVSFAWVFLFLNNVTAQQIWDKLKLNIPSTIKCKYYQKI